jgi:hypothetical protein
MNLTTLAGRAVLGGAAAILCASAALPQSASLDETPARAIARTLLDTETFVGFDGVNAAEAFEHFGRLIGVSVIVRTSGDRFVEGIDARVPLFIEAQTRSAISLLERMLDEVETDDELTWQVRGHALEVGPKSRLNQARVTRAYPVHDLIFEAPNFDDAPSIDLDAALQGGGGGGGTGGGAGGGGLNGGGSGGDIGGGGSGFGGPGGGNGGDIFRERGEPPARSSPEDRARQLIDAIVEIVEPDVWYDAGGDSTIRFHLGHLIVHAPDYVHRQIGGY